MGWASVPTRRHADFPWIGLGIGDELGHGLGWNGWVHHHEKVIASDTRDGDNIADEIEIEFFVERRVDRARRIDHEKRIAVWRRLHDGIGGDIGAGPRPVLDDEL